MLPDAINPEHFDFVLVDGNKFDERSERDLESLAERVSGGGLLVFDGIAHRAQPELPRIWRRGMAGHPGYQANELSEHEVGWVDAPLPEVTRRRRGTSARGRRSRCRSAP
jgi:predicted O-methyltransferase YrrM